MRTRLSLEEAVEVPHSQPPQRRLSYVGGTAFDNVTMTEAVLRILEMARQTDRARYVCTGNLDHLALLRTDAEFQRIYAEADLVLADGMPVIWLSGVAKNVPGDALHERVAGSDLFWEIASASATHGLRLFYLGGADGAAEEAAEAMRQQYPGAQIVGTYCPPYATFSTTEEQANICARVRAAKPHILLVGLGAPKQEKWIHQHKDALGVPVSIGVGGTFEMAAGRVRRAPRWMQRGGLEWVFRLGQEPTRLWKRYLFRDIPFFFHLLTHPQRQQAPLPAPQQQADSPSTIAPPPHGDHDATRRAAQSVAVVPPTKENPPQNSTYSGNGAHAKSEASSAVSSTTSK